MDIARIFYVTIEMLDDSDSTVSSQCSSQEITENTSSPTITDEELIKLIRNFPNLCKNYGLLVTLDHNKKKKSQLNAQSINNKECYIRQQTNKNVNLTIDNQKQPEIPIDIPRFSNQFFGRQETEQKLDQILSENKIAIVTGQDGIGKTEIAKYFIEKNYEKFDGNIIWINASTEEKFDQSLYYLIDKHQIPDGLNNFINFFKNKNWLVIVDNAYEKIHFRKYFPRSSNNNILMTTLFPDINNRKSWITLEAMTDNEATDIFQSIFDDYFNRSEENSWIELAKLFGKLPLALHLIGSCLFEEMKTNEDLTVEDYYQILKKKERLLKDNPLSEEYYMTYLALTVCREKIISSEVDYELILDQLNTCVYLDDDFISTQVLLAPGGLGINKRQLNNVLDVLKKYKIITVVVKQNTNEIHIHNLIRKMILNQQDQDDTANKYFLMALKLIALMGIYNIQYILSFALKFKKTFVNFILTLNPVTFGVVLHLIVQYGHDQILDHILSDLDEPAIVINDHNLLKTAIDNIQTKTVAVLIEHGADVNVLDTKLRSLLHKASKKRIAAILVLLLAGGARVNAEDYMKNTPLHIVARLGFSDTKQDEENAINCSRVLIKYGADLNAENIEGDTSIDIALENKAFKLALFLLEYLSIPIRLTFFEKIFIWEIYSDKEEQSAKEVIKQLLLKGANKNQVDMERRSLLLWAVDNRCPTIVQFLLEECGLNPNHQDYKGRTALHKVLSQEIPNKKEAQVTRDIVKILLEYNAATFIEDNAGLTAYQLGQDMGNVKLCVYVQWLNKELPDKKKKMHIYFEDKKHTKPAKQTSGRWSSWNNTEPYRESASISSSNKPGLLQYVFAGFNAGAQNTAYACAAMPYTPPQIYTAPPVCQTYNLLN